MADLRVVLIFGVLQFTQGQQVENCFSTGTETCYNNYEYRGPDGASCDVFKKSRKCAKAATFGYSDSDVVALYENCKEACGECTPDSCENDDLFSDYFSYRCSDWEPYNCTKASAEFGYSFIQEALIVEHCKASCCLCDDGTDSACEYPFSHDGSMHHGSVYKDGYSQCKTHSNEWKMRIPAGTPCVFPFTYYGVKYSACTTDDTDGSYAWCATKVDNNGEAEEGHWATCQGCDVEKTVAVGECDAGAIEYRKAVEAQAKKAQEAAERAKRSTAPKPTTTPQPKTTLKTSAAPKTTTQRKNNNNGMDDNGMNDNDNGMNDGNSGMNRRARNRRDQGSGTPNPEWISCDAKYLARFDPNTAPRRKVNQLDQYDSTPGKPSAWTAFVKNKPAFASVVALVVIVVAILSTVFGRWLIKRQNQDYKDPNWNKFKIRLNRYGSHQVLRNKDPFNG
eukprot:m.109218 g.109218  ORF g.109218 m.109218 type:complete len:450 (-) comp27934_c3_seq1:228-1577(-)